MRVDIKKFRKDQGIYQSDLAQILGLTQSSISRIESEGLELTKKQYDLLCDRYGDKEVEQYVIKDSHVINIVTKENDKKDVTEMANLIKEQHETLSMIVERQQEWINKYATLNERLLAVIEKMTMK